MKKVLFITAVLMFSLSSSVGAQQQTSENIVLLQHIATVFPYHSPAYVLANSDTVTVERKEKQPYQGFVGNGWIPTTIRIGETYLRFKGQYYLNVTQGMLIAKVAKQKKPFAQTTTGKILDGAMRNGTIFAGAANQGFSGTGATTPGELLR